MKWLAVLLMLLMCGAASAATSDFDFYKILMTNQTMIDQSIGTGHYPLLVSTTDTDLRDRCQADGDDIVFYDADNTTQLAHRIEGEFNSTTGELKAWIGLDDVTNVSYIVMYYNNSTVTNSEDPNNVWGANASAIFLMDEGAGTYINDSSSNTNNGTFASGAASPRWTNNHINFDTDVEYITVPHISNYNFGTGAFTLMVGMRSSFTTETQTVYGKNYGGAAVKWWAVMPQYTSGVACFFADDGSDSHGKSGVTNVCDGEWYDVACVKNDATESLVFVDGQDDSEAGTVSGSYTADNSADILIGSRHDLDATRDFIGDLRYVYIYNCSISPEEIATRYNNSESPALFIAIGSEQYNGTDTTAPSVTSLSSTPDPQGLGENVTISATITDAVGVNTALVGITPPGDSETNYSMSNAGSTYSHNFADWSNGTYNYTIYANDSADNWNGTESGTFELYSETYIHIKTLKDTYGTDEYVNITDPVNIPFASTFNCSEWEHTGAGPPSCEHSFWLSSDPRTGTLVTTDANYPEGAGVRGLRQFLGDGVNEQTSGLGVTFSSAQSEIWIRWYMRYESGFTWSGGWPGYDKWLYIDTGQADHVIPEWDWDEVNLYSGVSGNNRNDNTNWQTIMGGATGDGEWHCYEVHIKQDGASGIGQMWIDETLYLDLTNTNYGSSSFSTVVIGSNCMTPANGDPGYVDFDDIAISATGYIGPLSTAPVRSAGAPSGSQTAGTASLNISLTTDINATCKFENNTGGVAYDSMTYTFGSTGLLSHSTEVTGLSDGNEYIYCVKCNSTAGDANTDDYNITFSISSANNIMSTWDSSDGALKNASETIYFYVNYTNATGPINSSGDYVNISFADTSAGPFAGNISMVYNATTEWYDYNRSWATVGQYFYEVKTYQNSVLDQDEINYIDVDYQSRIYNKQTTNNITAHVLMQVEFYNTTTSSWVLDDVCYNTSQQITPETDLKLDDLFNGTWHTTDNASYGDGTYRVYVAYTDPSGNVLENLDGTYMNASYNFTLDTSVNTITLYANEYAVLNNWTADQTFSQIAANVSNDVAYSYYNSTSGLWEAYRAGYTYNANAIVPKNCSAFVFVNSQTTVSATPNTGGVTITQDAWFYGYLPGSTAKTLTEIEAAMDTDGLDVWSLYGWSNATQAYTATGSYSVSPNEGYAAYVNTTGAWEP